MAEEPKGAPDSPQSGRRPWRRLLRYAVLLVIPLVLLSGFGGLYQYSTSPSFCRSCHIMEPYYQAWAASKHNFVSCVECHYPPGTRDAMWVKFQALSQVAKFVTRTYSSKPFAEIEDGSCLRANCHATRLLEGDLTYKKFIKFNHREHLSKRRAGKQLRCTSCHSQIVVGTHMVVTETTCFLCHLKGKKDARRFEALGGCDKCHLPPDKPIQVGNVAYNHKEYVAARNVPCQSCHLDTLKGEGAASPDRCLDCHNKPEHLERFKDTPWIHDQHVAGKNVACVRCHEAVEHKIQRVSTAAPRQVDCQACHVAEHNLQQLMFLGKGGVGVPESPSPMYLARVDCVACHIWEEPDHTGKGSTLFQATAEACVKCHGESFRGMVPAWKSAVREALSVFGPKLEAAGAALEKAQSHPNYARARQLYEGAAQNMSFVKRGNPIHNIYYAAQLMEAANETLDNMAGLLSAALPKTPSNPLISGNFCGALCHPLVNVKMPEYVTWQDIRIPHRRHSEALKIDCSSCHRFSQHKQVTVKMQREDCLGCHHQAFKMLPTIPCEGCHAKQVAFRKGQGLAEAAPAPGSMASLPCQACHSKVVKEGHREADVRATCRMCHQPVYEKILDAWKSEVAQRNGEAEKEMRRIAESILHSGQKAGGPAAAKLADARKLLDTVALDQSSGFHNRPYALKLIGEAKKLLGEADSSLKLGTAPPAPKAPPKSG